MVGLTFVLIALVSLIDLATADQALMKQLVKTYQNNTFAHVVQQQSSVCKNNTLAKRQEWSSLSRQSRLDYIKAVKCLHSLPSKVDAAKAPGARSRYDDFQAAHIIETTRVHATGLFFAWHRWFVYLYETALREECGYQGYQPYWDWSKWANSPTTAVPLYDGSDTSLSGNGKYLPNRNGTLQPFPIPVPDPPAIYTAPGSGGGYIFSGPLVNWTQHLGPYYNQTVKNGQPVPRNPSPNGLIGLGYNPRPIIRDFNLTLLQQGTTYENVSTLVANSKTIHDFHIPFFSGPHLAGHSFISGVDNDLFTSPGDPLFWFHHAQVDRIYSIWQAQNFTGREYDLDGTLTLLDLPPTRNATIYDEMEYLFSPNITIGDAMSPTKGKLCYYYD